MKFNFAIIEGTDKMRRKVYDHFMGAEKLNCVMAVESVEKFVKYYRDFFELRLILLDMIPENIYQIPFLLKQAPGAEVVVFTGREDSDVIFQSLIQGASGCLYKDISLQELEAALLSVLNGEGALLSPVVARKILQYFHSIVLYNEGNESALNKKEKRVAALLNEGRSYRDIAQELGVTINGARYYVKNIYKKLNINNRGELIRLKNGIR